MTSLVTSHFSAENAVTTCIYDARKWLYEYDVSSVALVTYTFMLSFLWVCIARFMKKLALNSKLLSTDATFGFC